MDKPIVQFTFRSHWKQYRSIDRIQFQECKSPSTYHSTVFLGMNNSKFSSLLFSSLLWSSSSIHWWENIDDFLSMLAKQTEYAKEIDETTWFIGGSSLWLNFAQSNERKRLSRIELSLFNERWEMWSNLVSELDRDISNRDFYLLSRQRDRSIHSEEFFQTNTNDSIEQINLEDRFFDKERWYSGSSIVSIFLCFVILFSEYFWS